MAASRSASGTPRVRTPTNANGIPDRRVATIRRARSFRKSSNLTASQPSTPVGVIATPSARDARGRCRIVAPGGAGFHPTAQPGSRSSLRRAVAFDCRDFLSWDLAGVATLGLPPVRCEPDRAARAGAPTPWHPGMSSITSSSASLPNTLSARRPRFQQSLKVDLIRFPEMFCVFWLLFARSLRMRSWHRSWERRYACP